MGRLRLLVRRVNVTAMARQSVLLGCLALLACGGHPIKVQMTIATDANNNSPVLISVVFQKPSAVQKLLDMNAGSGFPKGNNFCAITVANSMKRTSSLFPVNRCRS